MVDGERFDVTERPDELGTYDFTWLSGPHLCRAAGRSLE